MKTFILAAAAALLLATPAFAHASLSPKEAASGASVKLAISIPHGCDGAPTDTVIVKLPEGFVAAKPQAKAGWTIEITKGDYAKSYDVHGKPMTAGALEIKWSGGSLPDDQFDEFAVRGSVLDVEGGSSLPFVTTQHCGDASVVWDQIAGPGEDAHALEHPAPSLLVTAPVMAHDHGGMAMPQAVLTLGDLEISGAFSRATLPNAPVGGGFLTIVSKGATADRLVSVASPAAQVVELHEMKMEGDMMKMAELADGIEIPAGGSVALSPGGMHIMFMGLKEAFVEGGTVPVTLTFEKAGVVEILLQVGAVGATGPAN